MSLALVRLLQLTSPTLPVGAYTYSQGLEFAIDSGLVKTEAQVGEWIDDALAGAVGGFELPLLARLMEAWAAGDGLAETAHSSSNQCHSRHRDPLPREIPYTARSLT